MGLRDRREQHRQRQVEAERDQRIRQLEEQLAVERVERAQLERKIVDLELKPAPGRGAQ